MENLRSEIAAEFAQHLRLPVKDIMVIPMDDGFHVFMSGTRAGNSVPYALSQRRKAKRLASELSQRFGTSLNLSLQIDDAIFRTENAILALLQTQFSIEFTAVFIKINEGNVASVRFEGNIETDRIVQMHAREIDRAIAPILKGGKLRVSGIGAITSLTEKILVSGPIVLTQLKIMSSADAEDIAERLSETPADNTTERAVRSTLDLLRRNGLVSHIGNGRHALTLKGLRSLPTRKDALSSDIQRALELRNRNK